MNLSALVDKIGNLPPRQGRGQVALAALASLVAAGSVYAAPALTKPAPVVLASSASAPTQLNSSSANFQWTNDNINQDNIAFWRLWVGSLRGASDIFRSGDIGAGARSQVVTNLPTGGQTIYVRLTYKTKDTVTEVHEDWKYLAVNSPHIFEPVPFDTISLKSENGCFAPPDVTFKWKTHSPAIARWWLYVGTAPGGANIHNSFYPGGTTQTTVSGIPSNGGSLYARLWYDKDNNGNWLFNDFEFTTPAIPAIISPNPVGSPPRIPSTTGTFEFADNGVALDHWWIYAGKTRKADEYLSNGVPKPSNTSAFINFPNDGSDVWVTLFWRKGLADWQCREYKYAASTGPSLTAPPAQNGDGNPKLPTARTTGIEKFTWNPNGTVARKWRLQLGKTSGAADVFDSGDLGSAVNSVDVPSQRIPTDGGLLYITLWFEVDGGLAEVYFWNKTETTRRTSTIPGIITPGPGTVLAKRFPSFLGLESTITWAANNTPNVGEYWVYVGNAEGAKNYLNSGSLPSTATSITVANLPSDGSKVWVRLWYRINAIEPTNPWLFCDFTYDAAKCPAKTSPAAGSTLTTINQNFTWNDGGLGTTPPNGINGFWITVSSLPPSTTLPTAAEAAAGLGTPGNADIDNSGFLNPSVNSFLVQNLPLNGSDVYVTLWHSIGVPPNNLVWKWRTCKYKSATSVPTPEVVNADGSAFANGGTLSAPNHTFRWSPRSAVIFGWWVFVGSKVFPQTDGTDRNYANSGFLADTTLSYTVTGLPSQNQDVFLTLWYLDDARNWKFLARQYKALNGAP